jgi:hypothetical protein
MLEATNDETGISGFRGIARQPLRNMEGSTCPAYQLLGVGGFRIALTALSQAAQAAWKSIHIYGVHTYIRSTVTPYSTPYSGSYGYSNSIVPSLHTSVVYSHLSGRYGSVYYIGLDWLDSSTLLCMYGAFGVCMEYSEYCAGPVMTYMR